MYAFATSRKSACIWTRVLTLILSQLGGLSCKVAVVIFLVIWMWLGSSLWFLLTALSWSCHRTSMYTLYFTRPSDTFGYLWIPLAFWKPVSCGLMIGYFRRHHWALQRVVKAWAGSALQRCCKQIISISFDSLSLWGTGFSSTAHLYFFIEKLYGAHLDCSRLALKCVGAKEPFQHPLCTSVNIWQF